MNKTLIHPAHFKLLVRRNEKGQHSLHSAHDYLHGEVICKFTANEFYTAPNFLTLQVAIDLHISLKPLALQYTNHSCSPNAFFDIDNMQLLSLVEIKAGEEITFFYPSTEWKMDKPFQCNCGNNNCLLEIRGAAYLDLNVLRQYRLNTFIQDQLFHQQG
jgi:hypothetical protein